MSALQRLAGILLAAVGIVAILAVASVDLPFLAQAEFAAGAVAVALLLGLLRGRAVSLVLVALSAAMSLRYLFWRATDTLDFTSWPELLLGIGLLAAEIYAVVALLLGYGQTAWPLRRRPRPLPDSIRAWPSVDVLIPTLNEPLRVVRATVLAALAMDWPRDRMRIWLLDDGDRAEFREFASAAGCEYLARRDRRHAKAGNLNAALDHVSGEFVAVFDCDHVPTRAFLQLTMGWLVAEPNLALVQTPQHLRTLDPFQRNLGGGRSVPAEERLFHGLVQDGNDSWNAAMFSGSCAVLRRSALDEVGGFATQSLTEDAQTSLRLHRRRWDSAFLRLPLAAGLAPLSLADHTRQRRRWTQGMLHILRRDCPLFGPGLSLGQRLCYLQASGHFLFALPRLAFLTAPLVYLLLRRNVIAAAPLTLLAYALPHLLLAVGVSTRLQGRWRLAFWGTLYETATALPLLPATLATLLRPRSGRFVVTPKTGGPRPSFDLDAVLPNLVLAGLLVAGVAVAGTDYLLLPVPAELPPLLLNAAWALAGIFVLLAAVAAGRERPGSPLSPSALPVALELPGGRALAGVAESIGVTGAVVRLKEPQAIEVGTALQASFVVGADQMPLPGRVIGGKGGLLRLEWSVRSLPEEARVVAVVFGRADAWTDWQPRRGNSVLRGAWRLLVAAGSLFRAGAAPGALAAVLLASPLALGQTPPPGAPDLTVRPIPGVADDAPAPPPPPPSLLPPVPAEAAPKPAQPAAPAETPQPASRTVVYTLRELGAGGPVSLRGTAPVLGVPIPIRADEIVTSASLNLSGAVSPGLIPQASNVTVTLNDQYVAAVPADQHTPGFTMDVPITPSMFQAANRLEFRLTGRSDADCENPLSGLLWATIADSSTVTLTLAALPPQRDLSRLPMPFLDAQGRDALTLPFVLPDPAGDDTLRAAGIAASWFGQLAGGRAADFPVVHDVPASGNAVVVLGASESAAMPGLPAIDGPTLAVLPNPHDAAGSLLLVVGRTGEEAVAAAQALAMGIRALSGPSATVQAPDIAAREPYDAPAWISNDHPVRLRDLVDPASLQSSGYSGLVRVPFRASPDFTTWRDRPFQLHLRWRAPPAPVVDLAASRLDVGLNGTYLDSLPLAGPEPSPSWLDRLIGPADRPPSAATVDLPLADLSGANELQFYFDARPVRRQQCGAVPGDLRMAVDLDSTLDLRRGYHFTQLPDLAAFVSSGFPFTRFADLSQTAAVLPDRPTAEEVGAFLDLMGRFGAETGLPSVRVAVLRPAEAGGAADRDLLVIGTTSRLQAADPLLSASPLRLSGDRMQLTLGAPPTPWRRLFGNPGEGADHTRAAAALGSRVEPGTAIMVGAASPLANDRSVVAVLAGGAEGLETALRDLRDPQAAGLIHGDLALLSGGDPTSYRVGPTYTVGELPFWMWPSWYLRDQPFGALGVLGAGCVALGLALFWMFRSRAAARLPPRD